jgi:hypothetical protein
MPNKFYIEYFEPKHLKKAQKVLEQYLKELEIQQNTNKAYTKILFSKKTLWGKVKKFLHLN